MAVVGEKMVLFGGTAQHGYQHVAYDEVSQSDSGSHIGPISFGSQPP
jgi:hypothetical protein